MADLKISVLKKKRKYFRVENVPSLRVVRDEFGVTTADTTGVPSGLKFTGILASTLGVLRL